MQNSPKVLFSIRSILLAVFITVVYVLVVQGVAQMQFATDNLLANGSFESGLDGWGVYEFSPGGDVTVEEGVLTIRTTTGHERLTVNQTVEIEGGKRYVLTARINTPEALQTPINNGSAYVRLQLRDANRDQIPPLIYTERVRETDGWTEIRASVNAPRNTVAIQVEIFSEYVAGTVQLKDINLAVEDTPVLQIGDDMFPGLRNGSFRQGLDGWNIGHFSGDGSVDVIEEGIQIMTSSSDDRLVVGQSVHGLPAGIPMQFQTYIKTEQMAEGRGGYVRLQFRDEEGGYTRSHLISESFGQSNPADEWTPIRMQFLIPNGTTRVMFELFSEHAAGAISYKDVSLGPLEGGLTVKSLTAESLPGGAVSLRWDVSPESLANEPGAQYHVFRSFVPDIKTDVILPHAIVSRPEFIDRGVRANRSYYYQIVPVFPAVDELTPTEIVRVDTGSLSEGDGPATVEAVVKPEGVVVNWSFDAGARVNYLDLYRYQGDKPTDFDAALQQSDFVGRAPFVRTEWVDQVDVDDIEQLERTWYLLRAVDPDGNEVQKRIVPVTGIIPRIGVKHDGTHPLLVVTKDTIERVRAWADRDISVRQLINFEIIRPARVAAAIWFSPQPLPGKDDNGGHASLAETAKKLGLAYQLQPDQEHLARAARNILMTYADQYVSYPKLTIYGGRVTYQTLNESAWLVQIAWSYDLIYEYLSEEERAHIEKNLLREAVANVQSHPRGRLNWQIWHNAGIGAAAFVMKDEALIAEVLETGQEAARKLFDEGLFSDGLWWEQSISYHNYTLSAWVWLALIAGNNGYDLFALQVGERTFKSMFDAAIHHAFQDLTHPAVGDTGPAYRLSSSVWFFGPALMRYKDPTYAWVLRQSGFSGLAYPAVFFMEQLREIEDQPVVIGNIDFAAQGRNDYGSSLFGETGMVLMRGSVRQKDGLGAALIYKPGGTFAGHQHADNLNLHLTALGHQWLAGTGTFPYSPGVQDQRHGTFARHTAAKNSLVVDGLSQIPQRHSNGLFTTDGAQTSRGYLDLYVPGPTVQLARGASHEVYPGVHLERTVLTTNGYVLDVYDAVGTERHRFDWIIHVTGDVGEDIVGGRTKGDLLNQSAGINSQLAWVKATGTLGDEDGMQYLTVEQKIEGAEQPFRLRWTSSRVVGSDRFLDQWIIPSGTEMTVYSGTSLWTINPGRRTFLAAQTKAESTRFVSVFVPGKGTSFVYDISWMDREHTLLRVLHEKGEDLIKLPQADERGGAVHFIRMQDDGTVTDFLMAGDDSIVAGDVQIDASGKTSISMGKVDDIWVLHHEGVPGHLANEAILLTIRGLPKSPLTLRDDRVDTIAAVDVSGDTFQISANSRETYVFAESDAASQLDLGITLGDVD